MMNVKLMDARCLNNTLWKVYLGNVMSNDQKITS